MPGKRRPMDVNLSVVDGGKHWTKDEIQRRQEEELKLEKPKELKAPSWLTGAARKSFKAYAEQLLKFPAGMVSELDTGTLARYCDCEAAYGEASRQKTSWLNECAQLLKNADADNMVSLSECPLTVWRRSRWTTGLARWLSWRRSAEAAPRSWV